MGAFQQLFGNSIGGFFASEMVQLSLRLIFAYIIVIWLAAAYWAFRDMRQRTTNLALPYVAAALVILFTPVFFWLGLIVYRIVRPNDRIVERRERELSEAVLLAEVGEIEQCAGCRARVQPDWMVCPSCRTELRERCRECERLVEFDWLACAWCGSDLSRLPQPRREYAEEPAPSKRRRPGRQPVPVMDEDATRTPEWPGAASPKVAMATGSERPLPRAE